MPGRRAVFLDRDGVVNRLVYRSEFGILDSPVHPRELELFPGVPAAIAALNRAGFVVLVVTNQPGIAKATLPGAELEELHRLITEQLADAGAWLDGIYVCPHHPDGIVPELAVVCDCRKPAAGLLLRAAAERRLDLRSSYMIGDGDIDVMAGRAAGATTFLVGNLKPCLTDLLDARDTWPDRIVPDLPTAVEAILACTADTPASAGDQRIRTDRSVVSSAAYVEAYLRDVRAALDRIDRGPVRVVLDELVALKRRSGRLFVLHLGIAAPHTPYFVTDFEQLDVVEAVVPAAPSDHQGCADHGGCTGPSLASWLAGSGLSSGDLLLVVGVADRRSERQGPDVLGAMRYARRHGARACVLPAACGRHAREARVALLGLLASHPEIGGIRLPAIENGAGVR